MIITLPMSFIDTMIKKTKNEALVKAKENTRYVRKVELDTANLDRPLLKAMMKEAREQENKYVQVLESAWAMSKAYKSDKFSTVEGAFEALKIFLKKLTIDGWLYSRDSAGIFQPWAVLDLELQNKEGDVYNPCSIRLVLGHTDPLTSVSVSKNISIGQGSFLRFLVNLGLDEDTEIKKTIVSKKVSKDYFIDVLSKVEVIEPSKLPTVSQLLEFQGLFPESDDLKEIYEGYMKRFRAFLPMYGKQFVVRGKSSVTTGWYTSEIDMTKDGQYGRAIMTTIPSACTIDNDSKEDSDKNEYGSWRRRKSRDSDEDEKWLRDPATLDIVLEDITDNDLINSHQGMIDGEPKTSSLPIDPSLNIYHLEKHNLFKVHASNMAPYKYRKDLKKMLVLPDEMLELTEMLVSTDSDEDEDVIVNKGQATVIACIGDPGLGKTLMAEVLSEEYQKPLYKIQAAQLGLSPEELETSLVGILKKAEVWGCVLLIDEANAYIHERGHDIRQNAIVGVFLRLLEYFKGICILTTNHSNSHGEIDIDDAIVSRCAAIFKFKVPTEQMAARIWKIQSDLLKAKLSDELIKDLTTKFRLSGRSIRQLLRLSNRLAKKREEKLTMKHFELCSAHISMTRSEKIVKEPK